MSHSANPEMLILAREARGYTQGKLAEKTGISQANISKYESGLLRISEMHLSQIAAVLHYPREFFYLSERRYGFGSSCTYHRKRQTMPVQELKTILAKLNFRRIQVGRLFGGADISLENEFPRFDIDDFDGDAARIAGLVRNQWKLPFGPVQNLVQSLESAGGMVIVESFGTRKLDAISQVVPGLPPVFLVNADMSGDRVRFTLAHELGHIIMHHVPTDNMEQEADIFASEFLMPAHDIEPELDTLTLPDLARLKAYWKVSMAALITRARDLGKISSRQYKSLFEKLAKGGYRINEPVPIALEEPSFVKDLVQFYLTDNGYSPSELALYAVSEDREFYSDYGLQDHRRLRIMRAVR